MNNIRIIISYIDPISAKNKPIQNKHTNNDCWTYNANKFAQLKNI